MRIGAIAAVLAAVASSASAAPALVWRSNQHASVPVEHSSEAINADALLNSAVAADDSSALRTVVFLVGRADDGSEALTNMASSGSLPKIQSKYDRAEAIHHNVGGIESSRKLAKYARQSLSDHEHQVLELTLNEFNRKMTSLLEKTEVHEAEVDGNGEVTGSAHKRSRALSNADVLIVNAPPNGDASVLDAAVTSAIESRSVGNVVLTAIRSTEEVKHERKLASSRRMMNQGRASRTPKANGRRRLEDEGQGENNQNQNNNQNNDDMEGVYYVNMTPNILAGLLFFFFFVFIGYTGIACLGMIAGQDVYVKKMPTIGREA